MNPHSRSERLEAVYEIADNLNISFCEAARIYIGARVSLGDGASATATAHGRTLYDNYPFTIVDIHLSPKQD